MSRETSQFGGFDKAVPTGPISRVLSGLKVKYRKICSPCRPVFKSDALSKPVALCNHLSWQEDRSPAHAVYPEAVWKRDCSHSMRQGLPASFLTLLPCGVYRCPVVTRGREASYTSLFTLCLQAFELPIFTDLQPFSYAGIIVSVALSVSAGTTEPSISEAH